MEFYKKKIRPLQTILNGLKRVKKSITIFPFYDTPLPPDIPNQLLPLKCCKSCAILLKSECRKSRKLYLKKSLTQLMQLGLNVWFI